MNPLRSVGRVFLEASETVGGITLVMWQILRAMLPPRFDRDETWLNLYRVGVKSYPIVIMTSVFTGAIMVIQSGQYVKATGATGLLGWGAGYAVLAEIGPVLIGLMFSGRVGANNTAELGTMRVTEQIDALRTLATHPVDHLVVPRLLALTVAAPLLTGEAVLTGIIASYLVGVKLLGIEGAWNTTAYVVHVSWALPFGFMTMLAVFNRFDPRLEEAALLGGQGGP